MYKKNGSCSECKHYNNEQHRCDAFCSFMKETCDDVYQQGREDKYQEIVSKYMLLTEEQIEEQDKEIKADSIHEYISWLHETHKIDLHIWETLDDYACEYLKGE